jgi:glyoxylase-like metal-dependent hydrolase (beta-lactamase superfamily II)
MLEGSAAIGSVAEDLDLELRTDLLAPLSRWVTPPVVSRRFDTRFFLAELPPAAEPSFLASEVADHRWMTARAALDALATGDMTLWWPTSVTLQQLEHAASFDEARTRLAPAAPAPIALEDVAPGVVRITFSNAGAIAGQTVNAWVVGRRDLVVVDPGDPSEAASDALIAVADGRGGTIRAVAITHADPDHAAGTEALARALGVPVFGGRGAGHDLPSTVIELVEGDRLPAGDIEIVSLATPGPREDHTAYVVPEAGLVLVGDLLGPGPSRSILGPPDVPAWLASLARVEALAPRRVLPGHGPIPPDPRAAIETQRRRLPPA